MKILLSTGKEKSVLIISNLRTEIHKNIDTYKEGKTVGYLAASVHKLVSAKKKRKK
jgi:hypothetical protein